MDLLLQTIHEVATGQVVTKPHRSQNEPAAVKTALDTLVGKIHRLYPDLPNARWVALRLLDGDEAIIQALRQGHLGNLNRGPDAPASDVEPAEKENVGLEVAE